jgi:hypothetical protein
MPYIICLATTAVGKPKSKQACTLQAVYMTSFYILQQMMETVKKTRNFSNIYHTKLHNLALKKKALLWLPITILMESCWYVKIGNYNDLQWHSGIGSTFNTSSYLS